MPAEKRVEYFIKLQNIKEISLSMICYIFVIFYFIIMFNIFTVDFQT